MTTKELDDALMIHNLKKKRDSLYQEVTNLEKLLKCSINHMKKIEERLTKGDLNETK